MENTCKELIGRLSHLLTRAGYRMATAESCTGGMVGSLCTAVAGSSDWFSGGVIAYANQVKERALGVPAEILEKYGAVSAEVVRQMALGALRVCGAQASVALSGVAGPGGGSPEKPVGTVWLAVAVEERTGTCLIDLEAVQRLHPDCVRVTGGERTIVVVAVRHHFTGDRDAVRTQAAWTVLRELADLLAMQRV